MKNVDGKMVKTNQRNDPGKQSVSKNVYRLLESYRKIEASNDKVLKNQLKTLETSKNKHYIEGNNNGDNVVYPESNYKDEIQGTRASFELSDKSIDNHNESIETDILSLVSHEMRHQYDYEIGNMADNATGADAKDPAEIREVNNENRGKKISGLPKKTTYGGQKIDPNLLKNPPNNR